MSVASPVVSVRGLEKSYGERQALRGVTFDIEPGRVFALLGPNGAGKTTTVEILEGFRVPSRGNVTVLGLEPWRHPINLRQRTGVVLQECGFPKHVRVAELLEMWRSYYERPLPLPELLDLVELTSERSVLVRHLSGGQRRRLDFAVALAGDPEVIFLDEPTTGFDPEARRRCWTSIENLAALGKTIVLTTHYLDEAERLADTIAILADGRIAAVGTATELARLAGTPTVVRLRLPKTPPISEVGGPGWALDGELYTIRTDDAAKELRNVLRRHRDVADLVVVPPSLEDTYLALTAQNESVTT